MAQPEGRVAIEVDDLPSFDLRNEMPITELGFEVVRGAIDESYRSDSRSERDLMPWAVPHPFVEAPAT